MDHEHHPPSAPSRCRDDVAGRIEPKPSRAAPADGGDGKFAVAFRLQDRIDGAQTAAIGAPGTAAPMPALMAHEQLVFGLEVGLPARGDGAADLRERPR
jgi:hypothetical protein